MYPLGISRNASSCSAQSSISKYDWKDEQDGSTALFDEDESSENGILINLVDYPKHWPDGSQES